jgi:uncharacterized membrane protein YoaK (UPF0700 family)
MGNQEARGVQPEKRAVSIPSIDRSPGLKALPAVLSIVAGSADVISFVGLGGLFVAHITGNLIILAARLVADVRVGSAPILSVPVFIAVLALTRVLAAVLEAKGIAPLRSLLLLQFLLLTGFMVLGIAAGTHAAANAPLTVVAAMFGVAAMAVQNALVQIAVKGAPSTAVMTTNVTRFTMDIGELLLGRDPAEVAAARRRAADTWPAIVGFAAGGGLGAALFAAVGISALALPAGGALVALVVVVLWPPRDR